MTFSFRKMNNLATKDFNVLEVDGNNYLTWAIDLKIKLSSKDFIGTIYKPNQQGPPIPESAKYVALHFLRHHLHPDLKNKYLIEEDPRALWIALKERYD